MANANFIFPLGSEHRHFSAVVTGKKHVVIDLERVKELRNEDEDAETIAKEMYDTEMLALKRATGHYQHVVTHAPVFDESKDKWVINKTLSKIGMAMYEALEKGLIWNAVDNRIDYEETNQYYFRMIENGKVEMRFVDLLINNTEPELKTLKNRLVYFKMQGQTVNNAIVPL